ncbi:DEAD/DEAH box helicase [Leucobacter sp. CSA2]|uniref:DEAD/DEAH box helicase n=1 Tax=Leucobacter edaphi TaxID=2796472 RepID=A0A934Q999_9MICO|nr:DEAD/DEAH box helicase [Leucobacter edaphi]
MAQRKRGGFKAPANYEPGRKPKSKFRGQRFADGAQGQGKPRRGDAADGRAARDGDRDRARDRDRDRDRGQDQDRNRDRNRDRDQGLGRGRDHREQRQRTQASQPAPAQRGRAKPLPRARVTTAAEARKTSFAALGLGGNLQRVLGELGADRPFPIQVATIPDTIAGRDVLGRARTGSGKTIAFGAGLVERLLKLKAEGAFAADAAAAKPKRGERTERSAKPGRAATRKPKALILAPTRELALQIDRTVQPLARAVGFYTAQLVGGQPLDPQIHALSRGIDIVIGTPGRVQDLVNRRKLDLREVVVTVIDEADHMCDLGFLEPVQRVLRETARRGQRLLFSATLDTAVQELVDEFLRDPAVHEAEEAKAGRVAHRVLVVLREDKERALLQLVREPGRIMVFCRTRAFAEALTERFTEEGIDAIALHGDLSQSRRERNLERFASGKSRVLVATDVAARGIHVDDVDLVLQADPPDDAKTYVHRAGRTGRAGDEGRVDTVIARTRQQRTREMLAEAGIEAEYFGDFVPEGAVGVQRAGWIPGKTPHRRK